MHEDSFIVACPACGTHSCVEYIKLANFTAALWPTAEEPMRKDLSVTRCNNCGHCFQQTPDFALLEYIYKKVYAESPLKEGDYLTESYTTPFLRLLDHLNAYAENKEILEIGCGDPERLMTYAKNGCICTGIDPSPKADLGPSHPNITIIKGYIESTSFDKRFDLIIMRFSLEHIVDINKTIKKCRSLLTINGTLIIQVPNNTYCIKNRPPLFAAHEHIHYFSQQSLNALTARHGLACTYSNNVTEPSLLAAYTLTEDWNSIFDSFKNTTLNIENQIEELLARFPKIIFYGWGMTFSWILTQFDFSSSQSIIVDDTQEFHGKKVWGTPMTVNPLCPSTIASAQAILLCISPLYYDRVLKKLRDMHVNIPVFGITGQGLCQLM
ncbi:MAG: hypothetical protein DESF_00760 [Desulfovibrio sp.]